MTDNLPKTPRAGVPRGFRRYTMTDDEALRLHELGKPRLILLTDPRGPQDLANAFWQELGATYGFDSATVEQDIHTSDPGTFIARPQRKR